MKRTLSIGLVVGIAAATAPAVAQCTTEVGGPICSDITWDLAGSPYCVTQAGGGSVLIGCDATLTIEPGVVVMFEPCLALFVGDPFWGDGTLVARATEESPIVFTSIDPFPEAGDWSRVHFTDYASDAEFDEGGYAWGCILEHVIVEYAGCGDYAALKVEKSSPFLNYCEVRHNSWSGISVDGTNGPPINIKHCEVWDHSQRGVYIAGGGPNHTLAHSNIHDNRGGGVYLGAHGNIGPGNTIGDNTTSGSGAGIYLGSNADNSTVRNSTISGNMADGSAGGIFVDSSVYNTTFTDNTITDNTAGGSGGGIAVNQFSDELVLTGNTIAGNIAASNGGGIYFYYSDRNTLDNNTISANVAQGAGGAIFFAWKVNYQHPGCDDNTLSDNTISDNSANGEGGAIYFDDGDRNTLWSNTITCNHTVTGETGGIYVTRDANWLSLDGEDGCGTYNMICCNDGYEIYNNNAYYDDGRNHVRARHVVWCTDDTQQIEDEIYDCFDNATKASVVWGPFCERIPGDLDDDWAVGHSDLGILLADWGCAPPDDCVGDIDGDGYTGHSDLGILLSHWGEACPECP